MTIGIIGAGHIGSALAVRLTSLGHTVYIANSRGPETLTDVAQRTGATPRYCTGSGAPGRADRGNHSSEKHPQAAPGLI
ncbi:NAD(P)-binding domain-containing protein [Hymenobacter sp. AT01-02]|uniref:NAD(P)-binding domain-containing protein n=1 Tax=Hymenobacter sp. AT01-02 TaxID=1571877 RepID=UPI001F21BDA4|nr:NAD(P)-binding domain-containing protein [Hymenobacter sp. AT01-02]